MTSRRADPVRGAGDSDPGRTHGTVSDGGALVARLRAAGCVFAEQEAEVLRASGTNAAELESLLSRRERGEPLEHLVGWVWFCRRRIAVAPGVFVPRRRTEFLAVEATRGLTSGQTVVELCCGAAPVATVLSQDVPGLRVHAADLNPVATACAARNLTGLGNVHVGDLYAALPASLAGQVDLIVANAPYVPTEQIALMPTEAREHEPSATLDGGADGMWVQRRIAAEASAWLAPGGRLLIETSKVQRQALAEAMQGEGLQINAGSDEDLGASVVTGRWVDRPS